MLVRIDDVVGEYWSHKLVFLNLERLLSVRSLPHISASETRSQDGLPAMRVRIRNSQLAARTLDIPDDRIGLVLQTNRDHSGLNSVLVFDGLLHALAPLNVTASETRSCGRGSELAMRVNVS